MATRLSQITALNETPASDDFLMIVDKSDTTSSADGTSKKIDNKFIIQTTTVDINNAQWLALSTTGIEIVPTPGSGFAIIPIAVYAIYTEGATPNTASLNSTIGYINNNITYYWDQNRFWMDSPSYTSGAFIYSGGNPSSRGVSIPGDNIANKPLFYYTTVPPSSGSCTGVLKIQTTYRIVNV